MSLKTDYQDAELSPSMGGKRRYNQIENADGTFSLEDRTAYTRLGDNFGAEDINATNREVNELNDSLQWKYLGTSTQPNIRGINIEIPNGAKEVFISVKNSGQVTCFEFNIPIIDLSSTETSFRKGVFFGVSNYYDCYVSLTDKLITVFNFRYNGEIQNCILKAYYR